MSFVKHLWNKLCLKRGILNEPKLKVLVLTLSYRKGKQHNAFINLNLGIEVSF